MKVIPKNIFARILVLFYVCAISWFGFVPELLIFERLYYVCLIAVFVFLMFYNIPRLYWPGPLIIFGIWMVWCIIGSLTAIDQSLVLQRMITVITRLLISFIILQLVINYRLLNELLLSFVLATILLAPLCIMFPDRFSDEGGRMYGLTGNANSFGIQVTAALLACTYFFSNARNIFMKLLWVFFSTVCIYLILATGSRKAIVGVLILFAVFSFFEYRNLVRVSPLKAFRFVMAAMLASVLFVVAIVNSAHYDRIERIINAVSEEGGQSELGKSEKNRLILIEKGIETGLENPVFGVGLKNFEKVNIGFLHGEVGTYAHSNYIELFATTGLIGVALYYLVWITTGYQYFRFIKYYPNIASLGLTMLTILLIYDLGGVNYYHKVSWTSITLIFCCLRPRQLLRT